MPVVRVEKHLLKESGGASFSVIGDDTTTMDQLRLLAARHAWTCEVTPLGSGEFLAQFRPH
jgi:hypothetical protein